MHPLDAISEPRRREILSRIAELGEVGVTELAEYVPISRPAVSQHLKVLHDAGVVRQRRIGRRRLYRINPEGIHRARATVEAFLVSELDDLETAARQLSASTGPHRETHPLREESANV